MACGQSTNMFMHFLLILAVTIVVTSAKAVNSSAKDGTSSEDRVKELEERLTQLSRQVMLQQFYLEEKIRSDGDSGIKSIRTVKDGTRNYLETSHIQDRFASIHDHANYDRTAGLGELLLVMNGVEFKTRHNDYKLRMPDTKPIYNSLVDIPFSEVPQSVLGKETVEGQIEEMQEYFRAFKDQNSTHRDYKPYFKPVLCYIEGAWTTSTKTLDEPFDSDRHHVDASSWMDLMEKVRFTSYSGTKNVMENYSLLPTTIMEVINGVPQYAQWNYRILCHPIKQEVPLHYFKKLDDLKYRFANRRKVDQISPRAQRFYVNEEKLDHGNQGTHLLDKLMYEIPGKNNYGAQLNDDALNMQPTSLINASESLNSAYYHRYFHQDDKGAMGSRQIHLGFTDSNLWVAQTDLPQVASMTIQSRKNCKGNGRYKVCPKWTRRYSYALPLEIIYMTPLQRWNPYNIRTDVPVKELTEGGLRNGGKTVDTAYNGTNPRNWYYLTPSEFYASGNVVKDKADTAKVGPGILDPNGEVKTCASSGVRIKTPSIGRNVGQIRLRYPILPVHGEGSGVWKELNALKDMTMHMSSYGSLFNEPPMKMVANGTVDNGNLRLILTPTFGDRGEHTHEIILTEGEQQAINRGEMMLFTTSEENGHTHELLIKQTPKSKSGYVIRKCDGLGHRCPDGHDGRLHLPEEYDL